MVNGLSDHDAQLLILYNKNNNNKGKLYTKKRILNNVNIAQFKLLLSYENWSTTLAEDNIDISFKGFMNTYIINFITVFHIRRYLLITI